MKARKGMEGEGIILLNAADLKRIESKLDLIIDAFGLSENHRLAPAEISERAKNIVLQFNRKRSNATKHERKKGLGL